jgi:8-oxo-dGTP diphosphatase
MNKKLGGLWEFPGGKIEVTESPETALKRELQEELELDVGTLQAMEAVYHDYEFGRIQLQPFLTWCNDRPPVELLEHSAYQWVTF